MKHLIFDTETTGLIHNSKQPIHKQPHVAEIFAITYDDRDWSEVGTFHAYVKPPILLSKKVTEITGITNDQLADKPSFKEIAPVLQAFMEDADVWVAHNLSYDIQVLTFEYQRLGIVLPRPAKCLCTVEATESIKGHRMRLMDLHVHLFGEGFESAHSAEHDVRATARCYIELVKQGEI